VPDRLALAVLVALTLAPAAWRRVSARPASAAACAPEGRGPPPSHWLGCAADPGPSRALADEERLLLGVPIDPNRASAGALAFVPGLGSGVAAAIVADRAERGPFASVDDIDRVRGIGPRRLARARPHLEVPPPP
jgi:competence protein ComEA